MSSTRASSFSDRKRDSVLSAAKQSFLERGFAATNLDAVADTAGVSKMTIYSHFGSKKNLFIQVLEGIIAERSTSGPSLDADIEESALERALISIAVDLIETVQDAEVVGLRRVLVAEQPRQPELASAWRRSTVLAAVDALADYFGSLQRRGLLRDVDPTVLATQFLWMLIGDPLDAALLDPKATRTTPRAQATNVVRTVLPPTDAGQCDLIPPRPANNHVRTTGTYAPFEQRLVGRSRRFRRRAEIVPHADPLAVTGGRGQRIARRWRRLRRASAASRLRAIQQRQMGWWTGGLISCATTGSSFVDR